MTDEFLYNMNWAERVGFVIVGLIIVWAPAMAVFCMVMATLSIFNG